ncbi:universal stress protein [Sulfoacidibacillus thermotolerans]|uniref:UspA domain-containing protein n=1 Tax=Sulfoacidibacillus thermotolerans TaxID=1765684 RepID=A0A2U3DBQ6_SULT2|nr:universal stress protein [Sulfoacidibacillus thermotolerans]PWI58718.1 hypothetical protein BM613_01070 [Sulfoacidibacillus thermotolerans]
MNVLIGYDGTESADQALRYALRTFATNDALQVHVLFVESIPYVNGEFGVLPVPYDTEKNRELLAKADQICQEYHVKPTLQSEIGVPADVILDTANKLHAELIVLGAHNKGALERLLLGSVSEAVTRRAHCSVLVVR